MIDLLKEDPFSQHPAGVPAQADLSCHDITGACCAVLCCAVLCCAVLWPFHLEILHSSAVIMSACPINVC